MQNIPTYREYGERLVDVCRRRGFELKVIGRVGPEKFPLYRIVLPGKQKTACLSAGIHGDERSGPLAVLKFLETYRHRASGTKLIMFPCLNPSGFDRNRRRTAEHRDPNRHWTDRAAHVPMHRYVKSALHAERIDHFLSLHEDLRTKFFLYVIGRDQILYYKKLLDAGGRIVPVHRASNVYSARSEGGLVIDLYDRSLEDWMHEHGAMTVACAEAPGRLSLSIRVNLNLAVIRRFVSLC